MLILIGCAPTAYALNRTVPESATPLRADRHGGVGGLRRAWAPLRTVAAARATVTDALKTKIVAGPDVIGALATLTDDVSAQIGGYGSLGKVPAAATPNLRNDMYLVLDTTKLVVADERAKAQFAEPEIAALKSYTGRLEEGTRFIPLWVKITVALALGLGTMVGWKRIVVTVGEKIGKTHLTYGMGASAEMMAAMTILLPNASGYPCRLPTSCRRASPAHRLPTARDCSGGRSCRWGRLGPDAPAAMLLAGGLYCLLLALVRAAGL